MMIPRHGSQFSGTGGHYESWFLRANHPHKSQAFWIRYTQFVPADARPALGELWAIWFDGDRDRVVAVRQAWPLAECRFSRDKLDVQIGEATLCERQAIGTATHRGHQLGWQLAHSGDSAPLLFLPEAFYAGRLPKAKSVVSRPQVLFSGTLTVDGEQIVIDQWPGSENHNWGSQHTDQYAWGQVAAFDGYPNAFLECITARVKVGPLRSPWLSIACMRVDGRDYFFNSLVQGLRSRGEYRFFDWRLECKNREASLSLSMRAPASHFTGLTYLNPPGGSKTCLNSKMAHCEATLRRSGEAPLRLVSAHGAAFEILTDRTDHGVALAV